jgi:hypothetical protein
VLRSLISMEKDRKKEFLCFHGWCASSRMIDAVHLVLPPSVSSQAISSLDYQIYYTSRTTGISVQIDDRLLRAQVG